MFWELYLQVSGRPLSVPKSQSASCVTTGKVTEGWDGRSPGLVAPCARAQLPLLSLRSLQSSCDAGPPRGRKQTSSLQGLSCSSGLLQSKFLASGCAPTHPEQPQYCFTDRIWRCRTHPTIGAVRGAPSGICRVPAVDPRVNRFAAFKASVAFATFDARLGRDLQKREVSVAGKPCRDSPACYVWA